MAVSASGLHFPDHIVADLEREAEADRHRATALAVDAMLKDLDPRLELVWIREAAKAPGLVPARWHIRRRNDETLDSYWPLTGPNGEYVEPGSQHVEMMRRGDLWGRDIVRELREMRDREARAAAKRKAEQSAERADYLATHIKSRVNPGVSLSDARSWTNRVRPLPGD